MQAMDEREAKTTATKERDVPQQMMAKNDRKGCMSHMLSAMEAMEK